MGAAKSVKIGIRYCGGCNPRYDRVRAVRTLEAAFPDVLFFSQGADRLPDLLIMVCGCSSRCAAVPDLQMEEEKLCWLVCEDDIFVLCHMIDRMLRKKNRKSDESDEEIL